MKEIVASLMYDGYEQLFSDDREESDAYETTLANDFSEIRITYEKTGLSIVICLTDELLIPDS